MVQRILNIFNKEFTGLHQAAYLLGAFALLSQVLALFRDRLLAHVFGASTTLDVYYAAFRIPDFIYISIASFVSITVLIPFLVEKIDQNSEYGGERARAFLSDVFSFFFLTILFVSGVAFFMAPFLAGFIVPGFSLEEKKIFVDLTRILLVSPVLLGISSLLGSVTQTYRKFFVYAGAPVLYNLGIITGIIFFFPLFGVVGMVMGVIFGALLHLLVQFPVVMKHGLVPRFKWHMNFSDIKRVVVLSLPRTIALSSNHISLIALIALASYMVEGSIAVFNFSFNLQSVPLSIIGVSYSVAAFPTLTRLFSNGERMKFAEHIVAATRHIVFWTTPAIILFIVLRAQIVRTILGSGEFDWSDTRLTAAALAVFSVSILAQALVLLFVRGYYAAGRTKIPLVMNTFSSALIIIFGFVFMKMFQTNEMFRYFMESLLRIDDIPGSAIVMLPLAYSMGMIINATLLGLFFSRDFKEFSLSLKRVFAHIFAASVIMGFVAYRFLSVFGNMFDINTFWGIFLQGLFAGGLGVVACIVVLKMLGNRELEEVSANLKRRLFKVRVIAPDQEEL
ncbi:MAG: murein biosynthesis integral membrane protein MurJ [Patescibacteria group bacterium]